MHGATVYTTEDGFKFSIYSGKAHICGYTGYDSELQIPSTVVTQGGTQYSVTAIANYAFEDKTTIAKVVLPSTVTYIGSRAFYGCISLAEISLNEGLLEIDYSAFSGCSSLKTVVIPASVTRINSYAFSGCISMTSATIKCNVLGSGMFQNCKSLKSATLAEGLVSISSNAFENCTSLTTINIPSTITAIKDYAFNGCIALEGITLNEGLTQIGYDAFQDCAALTSIVIPSTVTGVSNYAFTDCTGLLAANVKGSVVGPHMFAGCTGLKSVTLSDNVTSIQSNAFNGCYALTGVRLPQNLTTIGSYAFSQCNALTSIQIPASVSSMGDCAFEKCAGLKKAEIEAVVIGTSAFQSCPALTTVAMGDRVTSVGYAAFSGCEALQNVTFGSNVIQIGSYAFKNCAKLKTANIGEKVVTIGSWAFASSGLESVVIPASVKTIDTYAFSDCKALKNVSLVDGLTTIKNYAFDSCSSLRSIYIPASVVSISSYAFNYTGLGSGTVYCERGSVAADSSLYPTGTTIAYGKPVVSAPKFTVKGIVKGRSVTFNCDTKDAVIYYSSTTSALTTADKSVAAGSTVIFNNFYGTIYARAYSNGEWSNAARLVLKIPVVKTPTITETNGVIKISTATPNCIMYYTTDGSTPSPSNGIKVAASSTNLSCSGGTIKAIAVRSCFTNSDVATLKVASKASSSVQAPSFNVKGVIGGRTVTFTSKTKGAVIYYSTSSTMSTNDSKVSNGGSVTFEDFYGTVYARAYYNGQWSNVARLILKIPVVKTPTISKMYGYATITTATPNCTIYYTTDGSTPSPKNGRAIKGSSGRIYVGYGVTVKAIAVRSCFTNSEVVTK